MVKMRKAFELWFVPKHFTVKPHISVVKTEVRCYSKAEALKAARRVFKVSKWVYREARFLAYKPTIEERQDPRVVEALAQWRVRLEEQRKALNLGCFAEIRTPCE